MYLNGIRIYLRIYPDICMYVLHACIRVHVCATCIHTHTYGQTHTYARRRRRIGGGAVHVCVCVCICGKGVCVRTGGGAAAVARTTLVWSLMEPFALTTPQHAGHNRNITQINAEVP